MAYICAALAVAITMFFGLAVFGTDHAAAMLVGAVGGATLFVVTKAKRGD